MNETTQEQNNADFRIRMTIGSQFVQIQILQDQIAELASRLAKYEPPQGAQGATGPVGVTGTTK